MRHCHQSILTSVVLIICLASGSNAKAEGSSSVYTKWDISKCRIQEAGEATQVYTCKGFANIPVMVFNGPDSQILTLGKEDLTADEWPWETPFVFARETVEWRIRDLKGRKVPVAAIVRYDVGAGYAGPFNQRLVVYRITQGRKFCIATMINGNQAHANEEARLVADRIGKSFRCGVDKIEK